MSFSQLTNNDLHFIVTRLPKDVCELVRKHKLFVAGGFIRATIAGEKVSDFDLFGEDKNELEKIALNLALQRKGRAHKTDNAITILTPSRIPVQFITRWTFTEIEKLVGSFDFTVCQAAIGYKVDTDDPTKGEWYSCISDNFYSDLAARRLTYTMPVRDEDAGGSLLRVRKYIARGYSIQAHSLAGAVAALMQGVREKDCNLADKAWLTKILTGLLREVDPLLVVDGIDVVDEHQVSGGAQ